MQKRYLVLTELFLPTKGGTAVWFDEVYRRLGGKDIHIVTADVPGAEEYDRDHPNSIHRLSLKRVPWLKPESLLMYLRFFFTSLWLALTHRFDAIHAGRALPEGLVAWLVARLTRRPVAIYAHGEELTGWGRGNKYRAMRFALRHADKVIANSDFTHDTLVEMGVAPERIEMIHPGVDTERFRPGLPFQDLRDSLGLADGVRLILSVGRLSRRKGFDTVIRCLPAVLEAGVDVHYAVIGIGEDRDYLAGLVDECGVGRRVHLLGHVPMDDLPRWYNACDLFVLANRDIEGDTEGFGIVYIEAAACGKAAIAGRAGGTGSAVLDGVTGLRVETSNLDELQQAICRLLGDSGFRDTMSAAAMERAHAMLSWTAVAQRTSALNLRS
ncbi:glycosyltransferase family 4 protein [Thauera mechernichensis]|uniref:Glycosyltransferase family 4 protein n=1 Tax=Thauera mechernichensis TaxID=82788 RepID=A0ABW3WBQ5_9RHOO|nr:glycosyltransferase family 4 protein [Thauera mechernichensis]MDG3065916.1 glycosyltransferase family 4 protein [Thauera mechernichensis]